MIRSEDVGYDLINNVGAQQQSLPKETKSERICAELTNHPNKSVLKEFSVMNNSGPPVNRGPPSGKMNNVAGLAPMNDGHGQVPNRIPTQMNSTNNPPTSSTSNNGTPINRVPQVNSIGSQPSTGHIMNRSPVANSYSSASSSATRGTIFNSSSGPSPNSGSSQFNSAQHNYIRGAVPQTNVAPPLGHQLGLNHPVNKSPVTNVSSGQVKSPLMNSFPSMNSNPVINNAPPVISSNSIINNAPPINRRPPVSNNQPSNVTASAQLSHEFQNINLSGPTNQGKFDYY